MEFAFRNVLYRADKLNWGRGLLDLTEQAAGRSATSAGQATYKTNRHRTAEGDESTGGKWVFPLFALYYARNRSAWVLTLEQAMIASLL